MRPSHALSANGEAFHARAPKLDAKLRVISPAAAPNDHVKAAGEVRGVFSFLFVLRFFSVLVLVPRSHLVLVVWHGADSKARSLDR